MGKLFTKYEQSLEERAVRCVNVLSGVSESVMESQEFQDAIKAFKSGNTPNMRVRSVSRQILGALEIAKANLDDTKRYDKKLILSGRVAGLELAVDRLRKAKVL